MSRWKEQPGKAPNGDSGMNNQSDQGDQMETVTICDDMGRSLTCYVEHTLEIHQQSYLLLLPVDYPVEIFAWQAVGEDEEEPVLVEDEAEIDRIFDIAKAVLAEHNLQLKRTAVTLTVEGELPDLEDEDDLEEEVADEDDEEGTEVQLLANFFCEEQEYAVYTPLDPIFIPAKLDEQGEPRLLSNEEFQKIEPMLPTLLEEQVFEQLD